MSAILGKGEKMIKVTSDYIIGEDSITVLIECPSCLVYHSIEIPKNSGVLESRSFEICHAPCRNRTYSLFKDGAIVTLGTPMLLSAIKYKTLRGKPIKNFKKLEENFFIETIFNKPVDKENRKSLIYSKYAHVRKQIEETAGYKYSKIFLNDKKNFEVRKALLLELVEIFMTTKTGDSDAFLDVAEGFLNSIKEELEEQKQNKSYEMEVY